MDGYETEKLMQLYPIAPTKTEFMVIQFMNRCPESYYTFDYINSELSGIFWKNKLSLYRIINSMIKKGYIVETHEKIYRLTNRGMGMKVL